MERAELRALLLLTCRSCIEITSFISVSCLQLSLFQEYILRWEMRIFKFCLYWSKFWFQWQNTTDNSTTSRYASLQGRYDSKSHKALSADVCNTDTIMLFCHSLILISRLYVFIRRQILLHIYLHSNTYLQREIVKPIIKYCTKCFKNEIKISKLKWTFADPLFINLPVQI